MTSMRYRLSVLALLASVVAGTAACSSSDSDTSKPEGTRTEAPASTGAAATGQVDPKAFATALAQPGTVVLDVRTPEEFAEGHIPKARNIDVQASDFSQKLSTLDKSASYAVYCRSGKRSAAATAQMRAAGFTTVVDLAGGITAWTAAGNAVTTS